MHSHKAQRAMLVTTVLACAWAWGACKQPARRPDAGAKTRAAKTPGKPDAELMRLSGEALKRCTVTPYGVRSCQGDVLRRLATREQKLGASSALMTHCLAQQDADPRVRALAATRIEHLAQPAALSKKADRAALDCLMRTLTGASPGNTAAALIRAAAYLATAHKQEKELLAHLEAARGAVRSAGYGALWANGRLRVLPPLEKLLRTSKDVSLQEAVVRGFAQGRPWSAAEQKRLCALLSPLMTGEEVSVAGAAAERVASGCGDAMTGKVLAAAEAMLKRGVLDLSYVNAVGALSRPSQPGEQRARVTILLTRVVTGAYPGLVRSTALRNLHSVNAEAGRLLARRHRLDNSHLVASAARKILNASK